MESQGEPVTHSREPNYPGEDTRLTSRKEIWGWLSYGWAAEVFVVCGIGSFIPIALETLARERGVRPSDHITPCKTTKAKLPIPTSTSQVLADVATFLLTRSDAAITTDSDQCVVKILGREINTASFAMYTFSISVLVQAIVIISMSGAADHGNYRKRLLLTFALIGAIATMAFLPVTPTVFMLGALFAIIANTCFGASFVLLNSFLPVLVRHHPSVVFSGRSRKDDPVHEEQSCARGDLQASSLEDSTSALLNSSTSPTAQSGKKAKHTSPELQLSTQLSARGIGIGYCAAVLVQVFAVFIVSLIDNKLFSLRLVLFIIGLWWLVFTIPSALWLRPRPGPPIPETISAKTGKSSERTYVQYIVYAWSSLFHILKRARKLKDVTLFLCAWFLLSDGIATISGTAVLFAKTELKMDLPKLALINVVVTLSGIIGAFMWARVSRYFGLTPMQTIFTCIMILELIPLYGLLGYIPALRRMGAFGLQSQYEMYPLGAVYGIVLGGLSSYCRSLFGELIPPGSEAGFFALYAITDKGSSVFGPAVVGAITDRYGEIRPAFLFLAILVGAAAPLMALVDVDRGRREGAREAVDRGMSAAEGDYGYSGVTSEEDEPLEHWASNETPEVRLERADSPEAVSHG